MELSVVLITYNEAHRLAPTLEAAQKVADEIIIVDSGSTDETYEIARRFPLTHWYQRPFRGYGDQKNYANTLARGRYILSLDADEVLSPTLQAAILAEKGHWRAPAYEVLRVGHFCGAFIRSGEWYPDWKVRLFRRGLAYWSSDPVHEKLILPPHTPVQRLPGELWHYTYASVEESLLRHSRYMQLAAQALFQNGQKVSWTRAALKAAFRFLRGFLWRRGWRSGWRGWAIALQNSWNYFLREMYLAELYEKASRPPSSDTPSTA
ncbi:MAG: glycosyltransferase family 2 protein [Bacteroidia bacterium]|nr:glycosyltransferase family 2 protein [Bacteroidia bacterium]MDW8088197.1 glycosyltransferase family 2 protein [Bacteroidia bacterium]